MFNLRVAALAAVLIPTVASAQRSRTRGEEKADWNAIGKSAGGGLQLSNRDVEDISPIKLLIDKRKDLKLSDDQLKQLKDIEQKMKETNAPSFKALDSLRGEMRPPARTPTDDDRSRMMMARRTVPQVVATIRSNYESSLKDATALLNETQQQTAKEMLEKQNKEAEEMIGEKLGGGGGGGDMGGASGRRGRPPVA